MPATTTMKDRSGSAKEGAQRRVENLSRSLGSGFRISWGAVFAGALFSVSIWILLVALGAAFTRSFGNSAVFSGIWNFLAPLVALFIGAAVAGRAAPQVTRTGGGVHGFLVWSMAAVFGASIAASVLGGLLPAMSRSQAATAGGAATGSSAGAGALWVAFASLAVSLITAIIGAMSGVSAARKGGIPAQAEEVPAGMRMAPPGVPATGRSAEAIVDQRTAELRKEIAEVRQELRHAMEARDLPHLPPPTSGPH